MCFSFLARSISAVITYHDARHRPAEGGICVANHTSPIDALVLMCDNCYSLVSTNRNVLHEVSLGALRLAVD